MTKATCFLLKESKPLSLHWGDQGTFSYVQSVHPWGLCLRAKGQQGKWHRVVEKKQQIVYPLMGTYEKCVYLYPNTHTLTKAGSYLYLAVNSFRMLLPRKCSLEGS